GWLCDSIIDDDWHCIEYHFKAGTGANGIAELFVDETDRAGGSDDYDMDTRRFGILRLGIEDLDAGTSGTVYMDDVVLDDSYYIGLIGAAGVWYKTITYDLYRLWLSSTEYLKAEALEDIDSTSRWYYDSGANRLYVYATSNPASFYSDVEVSWDGSTSQTVRCQGGSWHIFESLDIRGGEYCMQSQGTQHFVFDDCNIGLYAGLYGSLAMYETSEIFTEYLTVKNCTIESGYDFTYDYENVGLKDGILLQDGANHCKIFDNTISNWGHSCINLYAPTYSVNDNDI
ncbi:unnamed protein product, partial [marine sediment metagenome]